MVKIQLTKKEAKLVYECVDHITSLGQGGELGYTDSDWKALCNAEHKLWRVKEGLTDD